MEEEKQENNPIENTNEKGVPSSPDENSGDLKENTIDNSSAKTEETENTENSPKQEEVIIEQQEQSCLETSKFGHTLTMKYLIKMNLD